MKDISFVISGNTGHIGAGCLPLAYSIVPDTDDLGRPRLETGSFAAVTCTIDSRHTGLHPLIHHDPPVDPDLLIRFAVRLNCYGICP